MEDMAGPPQLSMNLLMVSSYVPGRSWGAGTRSYYLLQALAHQHSVSLLAVSVDSSIETVSNALQEMKLKDVWQITSTSSVQKKRIQQIVTLLQGKSYLLSLHYKEEVQKKIDVLLTQNHYDAVLFEGIFVAGYQILNNLPVIIDQHNIEHELLQRTYQRERSWVRKWYNWWETRKLKPIELERCRKAQGVLVTSEREYLLLKQLAPQCLVEIVPNGVDTKIFELGDGQQEVDHRIVFTGTMSYQPNTQAVLFFARECWPLIRAQVPEATWQIVGNSPPPEVERLAELPGVTVTGTVPNVQPYLAAASVVVAPLLVGSGTRLKILEALAMQKAVVSTSLGCEGLAVKDGEHLMVVDQPESFAQAVIDLLQHAKKRVSLGNAGRALVDAEYSWERCGKILNRALEKMVR
jgi:polysaccharide biosynthesis protein PslH